ncbi:DNA polymerase-3 subunit epsilon [Leucobacter komagatae]|uniref:DNA polymerase-3 subunit epsilon n=1 Tax=Leucobacter komagatae TaxID=55969 RepID=A0A542Y582_9MICO|nr:exonuclease domain-containing protein [Leucobacter komagatae]TQL43244.1 DNA polymerase-3 subunit epsilon [Leucobacter komagatae]
MPFAVLDFETTGILPSYNHRVVEVGVTHVEDSGEISGRWETLINPQRDLGPQRIHGIRGADLIDAPLFEDIAPDLLALLRDRTFVAHNASFDLRFLVAEFSRAGLYFGDTVPHLCTMQLSRSFGVGGRGSLDSCCAHLGVPLVDAHSAGADSFATAQLLSVYIAATRGAPEWGPYWAAASAMGTGFRFPTPASRGVAWKGRGELFEEPQHFLERISDPPLEVQAEGAENSYLEALDRALLDHVISASEASQLVALADALGLSREDVEGLNRRYFEALRRRAWADGVLTEREAEDLAAVGEMLAIPASEWNLHLTVQDESEPSLPLEGFALAPGDHVVLTGEMSVERAVWEAKLAGVGLVPHPRVTKKSRLLVAADPDSLSGKAQQARKYGVPVVGEEWLRDYLR